MKVEEERKLAFQLSKLYSKLFILVLIALVVAFIAFFFMTNKLKDYL